MFRAPIGTPACNIHTLKNADQEKDNNMRYTPPIQIHVLPSPNHAPRKIEKNKQLQECYTKKILYICGGPKKVCLGA